MTADKSDKDIEKKDDEVVEIPDMSEVVDIPEKEMELDELPKPKKENKLKRLWQKYFEKKKITIPITIAVLLLFIFAWPLTRYPILGIFIKKAVSVTVVDDKTGRPVSEANVSISGQSAKTDGNGKVAFSKIKVGNQKISITKTYYADITYQAVVPIRGAASFEIKMQATGRQVPITVSNKVSGKGVNNVTIKAGESEARTDEAGKAVIVLSPNSQTEKATLSGEGYNNSEVEIVVTDSDATENKFTITPSGKIYFLSKKSGQIDVVKTNLDGSEREVIVAGTGNEEDTDTVLLASRDWKYLALKSRRLNRAKLYLIETATDKLITMDESNAYFTPAGWSNSQFIFTVTRNDLQQWQPGQQALKSFNAETKQLKTIDESRAEGSTQDNYAAENFGQIYILDNELVYAKNWGASYYSYALLNGKRMSINSIKPDSSDKKMLRDFDVSLDGSSYILGKLYKPQEVYFQVIQQGTTTTYFEYEGGEVSAATDVTADAFNSYYPTYLISPSGKRTFWYEPRDGKNTLFLGNQGAEEQKEIATLSDYTPYGWFSESYLLVSRAGSELFIISPDAPSQALKITDYHKPAQSFNGYGYGYGGI